MPEVTRGFNQGELAIVLDSNKFQSRVLEIAAYSVVHEMEGGLAVYKSLTDGSRSLSKPLLPNPDEHQNDIEEHNSKVSLYDALDVEEAKNSLNITPLTYRGFSLRRDIGMIIHSHPGESKNYLRPSLPDMDFYAELRGRNPLLIQGILCATAKAAKLLLVRESSTVPFSYLHDAISDDPTSAEKMIELLHNSGFNTAVVNYDSRNRKMTSNSKRIAAQLFR